MYVARLIVLSILILALVVIYSPFAGGELSQAWKDVRPTVLDFMDNTYASLRSVVAGTDSVDREDDHAPGVDFDRVITMKHESLL